MSKNQVKVAGLESAAVETKATKVEKVVRPFNLKELKENELVIVKGNTYSNYKEETEPDIQNSLKSLGRILDVINPKDANNDIAILMGKYWNDRETFAVIKKEAEERAAKEGIPFDIYMETKIRPIIEKVDTALAVSRIKYALNYLKPREGKAKVQMQQIIIDKKVYEISDRKYHEIKTLFAGDKDAIKKALLKEATEVQIVDNY